MEMHGLLSVENRVGAAAVGVGCASPTGLRPRALGDAQVSSVGEVARRVDESATARSANPVALSRARSKAGLCLTRFPHSQRGGLNG